jgi:hypothetical protein
MGPNCPCLPVKYENRATGQCTIEQVFRMFLEYLKATNLSPGAFFFYKDKSKGVTTITHQQGYVSP